MRDSVPVNTKEIIKLKDIELSGLDVRLQLKKSCIPKYDSSGDCAIDTIGVMQMGKFTYGNVGGYDSDPFAYIGNNGELLAFQLRDHSAPDSLVRLSELLTEKYGLPKTVHEKVHKVNGKEYFEEQIYWKDSRGTVIAIDTIYRHKDSLIPFNLGMVNIMSKDFIDNMTRYIADLAKKYDEAEKKKKKENLDNL